MPFNSQYSSTRMLLYGGFGMKRFYLLFMFIVLPLFLLGNTSIHSFLKQLDFVNHQLGNTRGWRMTEMISQNYSNNTWEDNQKEVYYYNAIHPTAIDSIWIYEYDSETNDYIHNETTYMTYDSTHEYVVEAMTVYAVGEMSIPVMRVTGTYDDNNRLVYMGMYSVNPITFELINVVRQYIHYGENNTFSVYNWDATDDVPEYSKYNFTYDANGRILEQLTVQSPDSTSWVNHSKTSYTYHPNDTTTGASFIVSVAHSFLSQHEPDFGMVTEEYGYEWVNEAWENDYKTTSTYNEQNKLAERQWMFWNNAEWNNSEKQVSTYDTNGNLYQALSQQTDWNGGWQNNELDTYTWEQVTSSDDPVSPIVNQITLAAYPNPFNRQIELAVNSRSTQQIALSIYNVRGQLVHHTTVSANTRLQWDDNNVGSGIYFVKAQQGNSTQVTKILKLK